VPSGIYQRSKQQLENIAKANSERVWTPEMRLKSSLVKLQDTRFCTYPNCKKIHSARGYCVAHYCNLIRHGKPDTPSRKGTNLKYETCTRFGCNKPHIAKGLCINHYSKLPREKARRSNYMQIWKKKTGRFSTIGSIKLQKIMANVRLRDSNTCQWQKCRKTDNIHVHHIFPRAEYPELEFEEKYMICYCKEHHYIWHKSRGDMAGAFLGKDVI